MAKKPFSTANLLISAYNSLNPASRSTALSAFPANTSDKPSIACFFEALSCVGGNPRRAAISSSAPSSYPSVV